MSEGNVVTIEETLKDLVVEGSAFRCGDVVILRVKYIPTDLSRLRELQHYLEVFSKKTGVEFLLVDDQVEIARA